MSRENMPGQRRYRENTYSSKTEATAKTKTRRAAWLFFSAWVAFITVPLAALAAAHMAALPVAKEAVASKPADGWKLVHVLSEDCSCSRSVMDYLLERRRSPDFEEEVILLGERSELEDELAAAGFQVQVVEAESFCAQFASEGVPFFQVIEGDAAPRYSGAYFDSAYRGKGGFLDLSTLQRLQAGGLVVNRPVYGCPTSDRLKRMLDPFSLK